MMFLRSLLAMAFIVAGVSSAALAQERPGSLTITVYDTTGAAIAAANVNLTKPDGTVDQQLADEKGTVTFQGLVPGKYAAVAEFPGFDPNAAAELNVRAGRNTKQDITLEIAGFVEQVEVEQDTADRAVTESFSTALSASQIEALADDPDEMQQQLEQLAGPGARIRVNGFEGGQLPPKSQIREIRFRFDPFAAENHDAGFPRVDIITRPGNGPIRNNMTFGFRDNSLDAPNFFSCDRAADPNCTPVRAGPDVPLRLVDRRPHRQGPHRLLAERAQQQRVRRADDRREHAHGQLQQPDQPAVRSAEHRLQRRARAHQDPHAAVLVRSRHQQRGEPRHRQLRPRVARLQPRGLHQHGARVRHRHVLEEVPQRDPRPVLLAGERVALGEQRPDHPRAGRLHRRRRADPGRPALLGDADRQQPRHPGRQEAQPAHGRRTRDRQLHRRRAAQLRGHVHLPVAQRVRERPPEQLLDPIGQPARRVPQHRARAVHPGRLPVQEEPAAVVRRALRGADAHRRQDEHRAARGHDVVAVQEQQDDDPRRRRHLLRLVRNQPVRELPAAGRHAPVRHDHPQPRLPEPVRGRTGRGAAAERRADERQPEHADGAPLLRGRRAAGAQLAAAARELLQPVRLEPVPLAQPQRAGARRAARPD